MLRSIHVVVAKARANATHPFTLLLRDPPSIARRSNGTGWGRVATLYGSTTGKACGHWVSCRDYTSLSASRSQIFTVDDGPTKNHFFEIDNSTRLRRKSPSRLFSLEHTKYRYGPTSWSSVRHFSKEIDDGGRGGRHAQESQNETEEKTEATEHKQLSAHGSKLAERSNVPDWVFTYVDKSNVNIPNAITFGRILVTPYLGYLIVQGHPQLAFGIFVVAGLSDYADGWIAKNMGQMSVLGSFLDPLADKIFVTVLSLSLAYSGMLPLELLALIIARDLALVGGTFYHRYLTRPAGAPFFDTKYTAKFKIEPSMISKANTVLQFSLLGLTLSNAGWNIPGDLFIQTLWWTVAATTTASGLGYVRDYYRKTGAFVSLRNKKK